MNKFKTWICEKFFKKEIKALARKEQIINNKEDIFTIVNTNKKIEHLSAIKIIPLDFFEKGYCDEDFEQFIKRELVNSFETSLIENFVIFSKAEKNSEGNFAYRADLWVAKK